MFQDARHNTIGELEGPAADRAVDPRGFSGAYGVRKGAKLGAEGLFVAGAQRFEPRHRQFGWRARGTCGGRIHLDAQNILAGEVDRDVFMLLKEAHLADAFGGDPAGGEIGDGPGFEFDPCVSDVYFVG
jgi:hypothetical protein